MNKYLIFFSLVCLVSIVLISCKKSKNINQQIIKNVFNLKSNVFMYKIINDNSNDVLHWQISPLDNKIINQDDGHFLILAKYIKSKTDVENCYININLPERIIDYVILSENDKTIVKEYYNIEEVIPAIASEVYGNYETFYSKIYPELSINILKNGLNISSNKGAIAEDLGYILRDERQFKDAIEAFLIAIENEPSSNYIYKELADLYKLINNTEKENFFRSKCKDL